MSYFRLNNMEYGESEFLQISAAKKCEICSKKLSSKRMIREFNDSRFFGLVYDKTYIDIFRRLHRLLCLKLVERNAVRDLYHGSCAYCIFCGEEVAFRSITAARLHIFMSHRAYGQRLRNGDISDYPTPRLHPTNIAVAKLAGDRITERLEQQLQNVTLDEFLVTNGFYDGVERKPFNTASIENRVISTFSVLRSLGFKCDIAQEPQEPEDNDDQEDRIEGTEKRKEAEKATELLEPEDNDDQEDRIEAAEKPQDEIIEPRKKKHKTVQFSNTRKARKITSQQLLPETEEKMEIDEKGNGSRLLFTDNQRLRLEGLKKPDLVQLIELMDENVNTKETKNELLSRLLKLKKFDSMETATRKLQKMSANSLNLLDYVLVNERNRNTKNCF